MKCIKNIFVCGLVVSKDSQAHWAVCVVHAQWSLDGVGLLWNFPYRVLLLIITKAATPSL